MSAYRSRPAGNRAANQEHSGGKFEGTSIVSNPADVRVNQDGVQVVAADAGPDGVPWDVRSAIWTDAFKQGYRAGMCAHIREELGALADASSLLSWLEARVLAHAEHGEGWADLLVGEKPGDRS